MSAPDLLRSAWHHVKVHVLSLMAAVFMFAGIYQIIDTLQYPLTNLVTVVVNFVILRAFRDIIPLNEYSDGPWTFHTKQISEGVIVAVVGMFLGLWAQLRFQGRSSQ